MMIRGSSNEDIDRSLGLGPHLVGRQIDIHGRNLEICKQLGEGGFSFVYLVGESCSDNVDLVNGAAATPQHFAEGHRRSRIVADKNRRSTSPRLPRGFPMVLKITSVHNVSQRQMAEKEAELLQTLSHPSIVEVYDHGFRNTDCVDGSTPNAASLISSSKMDSSNVYNIGSSSNVSGHVMSSKLAQHLILMEYCEGGTAFDAIKRMKSVSMCTPNPAPNSSNNIHRFDLPSLVISFGQICNAVSYLHAQRPPIIHRDLKPVNFLLKNGAYKLCDFGSAVVGHTDLRTPESRRKAEEVVNKTTTQMFRAPEMVDLYMSKRLTQSTDVWALGCCLYSLAFLRDCFEEGSNLAILSQKYKIPDDNPYGNGLADLIDRMLVGNYRDRADMSEVIMCLSALYSNRSLPKRKLAGKLREEGKGDLRMGAYRTDGQGIRHKAPVRNTKAAEAKKLDPNSAAAKRKKASEGQKNGNNATRARAIEDCSTKIQPSSLVNGCHQNFASFDRFF